MAIEANQFIILSGRIIGWRRSNRDILSRKVIDKPTHIRFEDNYSISDFPNEMDASFTSTFHNIIATTNRSTNWMKWSGNVINNVNNGKNNIISSNIGVEQLNKYHQYQPENNLFNRFIIDNT